MGDTLALNRVHIGDIRDLAPRLAPGSVNCIVTSPPYMGLRDYGTARWEGGDAGCDHLAGALVSERSTLNSTSPKAKASGMPYRDRCGKCGAVRVDRQLGLEPTVGEFVANLVAVFRALKPALHPTATCWINLGDSYANNPSTSTMRRSEQGNGTGVFRVDDTHMAVARQEANRLTALKREGIPHKCLTLAPARFAIAMVDDGWILRNAIIWQKPNPMPESVTDRFTSSYEHVFLFAKRPNYWADMEAVREPHADWERGAHGARVRLADERPQPGVRTRTLNAMDRGGNERAYNPAGRNARDVWTIPTAGFPGAHYATFPPELARRCIRAGCPPRVCARCGSPWVRRTEDSPAYAALQAERGRWGTQDGDEGRGFGRRERGSTGAASGQELAALGPPRVTTGWRATCACGPAAGVRPGVVVDCFAGSGTTPMVAVEEGRSWLAVDLDGRAVGWTAARLAKTQIRLPLWQSDEAAGG